VSLLLSVLGLNSIWRGRYYVRVGDQSPRASKHRGLKITTHTLYIALVVAEQTRAHDQYLVNIPIH
jgi:hypothetical protein